MPLKAVAAWRMAGAQC